MKMYDVSYEWDSSCCVPADGEKKEKRKEYPCLYLRGKDIPKMEVDEDGFGVATIKFRILGYREPSEGEKTLELEVHEIGSDGAVSDYAEKREEDKESTEDLDATFEKIAKGAKDEDGEDE
jgi:hypothetical protein